MPLIKPSDLQTLVRHQTEYQTSPLLKDSKMIYKFTKNLGVNLSFQAFLLQRNAESLYSDDQIMYQIILKKEDDLIFQLDLSLKEIRKIFEENATSKEELDEILIHFKSNKSAFIRLLNCIQFVDDDKLILDISKIDDPSILEQINQLDGKETYSQYESSKTND